MNKTNTHNFDRAFSKEILESERIRLIIISVILAIIVIYISIISITMGESIEHLFKRGNPLYLMLILLVFFSIRSLFVRKIWSKLFKRSQKLPEPLRYINALFEISIPTILILTLSINLPSGILLHTPAIFLYFIFIILSIFELDFKICLFSGFFAALEFLLLVYLLVGDTSLPVDSEFHILTLPLLHYGKAMFLLLAGCLAGILTNQIKKRIYNSFATIEERNNIEKLFGQQVSSEIVDEILYGNYDMGSKRRHVCIMFLDIREFTPFSEGKQPEDIIQFQNDVFSFMIEIINKNHGIINQFMGDGFMATFGAPVSKENDCQNALNAAIEIEGELKSKIKEQVIPKIKIGMGLHAGDVVTGNVGTSTRKQYSVTGNVVILASRIEQLNKQYQSSILISKEVFDNVQIPQMSYISMGLVHVKGRQKPIEIYQVT